MAPNESYEEKRIATLSAFQRMREANLARNSQLLKHNFKGLSADLTKMLKVVKNPFKSPSTNTKLPRKVSRTPQLTARRKSVRIAGGPAPEYEELEPLPDSPTLALVYKRSTPKKPQRPGFSRGKIDSGKGVRYQGGRMYDSTHGETCHWCRQKTVEDKVRCTAADCGKGRRQVTVFCQMCLRNRHGEDIYAARASGCWICPPCRGTCGEGCDSCCNCSFCRLRVGLAPTGLVKGKVVAAGFDNTHDWLVHLTTGESAQAIKARKLTFEWGQFLRVGQNGQDVERAATNGEQGNGQDQPGCDQTACGLAGGGSLDTCEDQSGDKVAQQAPVSGVTTRGVKQGAYKRKNGRIVARVMTRESTPQKTRAMKVVGGGSSRQDDESDWSCAVVMAEVVADGQGSQEASGGVANASAGEGDISEDFLDAAMALCDKE